jgi:RNA polymerase sigma-70 factor (ECF subfamily)
MKPSPDTRFSLIEKLKRPEDMDAWSEFVSIYQPLIVGICRKKGLQHADANDVAQEVLSRVAKGIQSFDYSKTGATFRGWLYRITRNLTVDFFRRRDKDPLNKALAPNDFHLLPEPSADESREFDVEFQRHLFLVVAQNVESQMRPQTWAAFWKVEIERQDPSKVAEDLGVSRGAVYVAKSRVVARLRKEVQSRLEESSQFFVDPKSSTHSGD